MSVSQGPVHINGTCDAMTHQGRQCTQANVLLFPASIMATKHSTSSLDEEKYSDCGDASNQQKRTDRHWLNFIINFCCSFVVVVGNILPPT